ncbi:MAG TPA: oligopeptide/dipeptide ABC transporter ATP-binding protein, partial [Micromonosporaceae bacterium]
LQTDGLAKESQRIILTGEVPNAAEPPAGCNFRARCWLYQQLGKPERCASDDPQLHRDGASTHEVACHFPDSVPQHD